MCQGPAKSAHAECRYCSRPDRSGAMGRYKIPWKCQAPTVTHLHGAALWTSESCSRGLPPGLTCWSPSSGWLSRRCLMCWFLSPGWLLTRRCLTCWSLSLSCWLSLFLMTWSRSPGLLEQHWGCLRSQFLQPCWLQQSGLVPTFTMLLSAIRAEMTAPGNGKAQATTECCAWRQSGLGKAAKPDKAIRDLLVRLFLLGLAQGCMQRRHVCPCLAFDNRHEGCPWQASWS